MMPQRISTKLRSRFLLCRLNRYRPLESDSLACLSRISFQLRPPPLPLLISRAWITLLVYRKEAEHTAFAGRMSNQPPPLRPFLRLASIPCPTIIPPPPNCSSSTTIPSSSHLGQAGSSHDIPAATGTYTTSYCHGIAIGPHYRNPRSTNFQQGDPCYCQNRLTGAVQKPVVPSAAFQAGIKALNRTLPRSPGHKPVFASPPLSSLRMPPPQIKALDEDVSPPPPP